MKLFSTGKLLLPCRYTVKSLILKIAEHLGIYDVLRNSRTHVNFKFLPDTLIVKFMAFINHLLAHSLLFFFFNHFFVIFTQRSLPPNTKQRWLSVILAKLGHFPHDINYLVPARFKFSFKVLWKCGLLGDILDETGISFWIWHLATCHM